MHGLNGAARALAGCPNLSLTVWFCLANVARLRGGSPDHRLGQHAGGFGAMSGAVTCLGIPDFGGPSF